MGPVQRDHSRADVVERMLALLHDAHGRGAELVVYPELALTTFFPRWFFEDEAEIDSWFETEMPSVDTKPLFDEAARLGVGFCLGFAEKTPEGHRYNTQVLVGRDGREIGRYRKVHLPGHDQHEPWREFQHLGALLRGRPRRLPGVARLRGRRGNGDLQRPSLARGLPSARAAGRRARADRLQHAGPQPAGTRA
jgi:predicted amidohydrolase